MLDGQQALARGEGGGCGVLHQSMWACWATVYHCGSGLVSCSVPEPLHLMLPLALLANSPVNQGSIGTPVVSISGCFSLFDKAIVLDGYNGWVSVGGWAGLQDPRHRGRGVIS